jgi:hypothetical protein
MLVRSFLRWFTKGESISFLTSVPNKKELKIKFCCPVLLAALWFSHGILWFFS